MEIRKESLLYPDWADCDYTDSFEYVIADSKHRIDVLSVTEAFVKPGPSWFEALFKLRNKMVSVFKLKTPATLPEEPCSDRDPWELGKRAGMFKIFGKTPAEMVLGEDDKHLDVRISLLLQPNGANGEEKKVTVTTVVKLHNRLGKCYFFFVKPFHRMFVPLLLKQKFRQLEAEAGK